MASIGIVSNVRKHQSEHRARLRQSKAQIVYIVPEPSENWSAERYDSFGIREAELNPQTGLPRKMTLGASSRPSENARTAKQTMEINAATTDSKKPLKVLSLTGLSLFPQARGIALIPRDPKKSTVMRSFGRDAILVHRTIPNKYQLKTGQSFSNGELVFRRAPADFMTKGMPSDEFEGAKQALLELARDKHFSPILAGNDSRRITGHMFLFGWRDNIYRKGDIGAYKNRFGLDHPVQQELLNRAKPILERLLKYGTMNILFDDPEKKKDVELVRDFMSDINKDAYEGVPVWMRVFPFTAMAITIEPYIKQHKDVMDHSLTVACSLDVYGKCGGGEFVFPPVGGAVEMFDGATIVYRGSQITHGAAECYPLTDGAIRIGVAAYSNTRLVDQAKEWYKH